MTSQQLIEARAALWHHNAEPILTLDDAASWVATNGFLLFLPRRQQLRAPSPTFVEACMGKLEHTPARTDIENAMSLAHRLFDSGDVLPLNLLGTLSEEPDFLIARDRLPWLLSLRGDRAWKAAPGGRTSPLNISIWKLLDEQGELTADQIRSGIGREVTDASIRRALVDLWGTLRVFPRYRGDETTWTLAKTLCPKECTKGTTTAQGVALSLFLADYLRSVIAATEDEIAAFLSPLASRSKLREVLHALLSTRQISTIPLGPNTLYYVAGELPEFPEIAMPEPAAVSDASVGEESDSQNDHATPGEQEPHERIRKYAPRGESREPFQRREPYARDRRPQGDFRRDDSRRPAARGDFKPRRSEGGWDRPPRDRRDDREQRPEGRENRPARRESGFRRREEFRPREKREFKPRGEGGSRPLFRKPRAESESGFTERDRPERAPRSNSEDRPPFRKPFGERKPYGERKSGFGERDRKPFARKSQDGGERKSYGERKPYGDRKRPDFRSREENPRGERSSSRPDFRKERDGEGRPPFRKSGFGDRDRKPFARKSQDGGDRKPYGERKPYGDRKRPDFRSREENPRSERSSSRPDFRKERDGEDRPRRDSDSSSRPPRKNFGKPGGFSKSGGKSFGKPGSKGGKAPFGKGPGKGPGKPAGKSGFGKSSGKSFGKKFSKGPGKGPAKGSFRGAGKPRRRPE